MTIIIIMTIITCDGCFVRQSSCSVTCLHSGLFRAVHRRSFRRQMLNINTCQSIALSLQFSLFAASVCSVNLSTSLCCHVVLSPTIYVNIELLGYIVVKTQSYKDNEFYSYCTCTSFKNEFLTWPVYQQSHISFKKKIRKEKKKSRETQLYIKRQ